jgi:hypothetical protein
MISHLKPKVVHKQNRLDFSTRLRTVFCRPIRIFAFSLLILLFTGCTLKPHEVIPSTPGHNLAVVFDIDGTLTTRVLAIGDTRKGAVAAVQAYSDAGFRIIYISARTPLFQWQIPGWLERNGFPEGPVHVTESREQRNDHASFKHGVLNEYRANGWVLVAAYGDSSTDFDAYANSGIDKDRVFALKREGAEACEPGAWAECFANWPEQMGLIDQLIQARFRIQAECLDGSEFCPNA